MRRKPESPIETQKREIAEREARNRAEMEKCERFIEKAPSVAAKIEKARHEKAVQRASRAERRTGSIATLPDPWRTYEADVGAPAKFKRMRAERRQGRLLFFFLFLVFIAVCYVFFYTLQHS